MATYNITNLVPNVTSGNKSITIEANDGYNLPSSVSVSGGTLVSYNSSTGVAVVSGDNAVVSATCESAITSYLTFHSDGSAFTLNTKNNTKNWDGSLYYSTNLSTWTEWNGTTTISSSSSGYLYIRGVGNTKIAYDSSSYRWIFAPSTTYIYCNGNIETLLDYPTVIQSRHPPMARACFSCLFYSCTNLKTAPELLAETLSVYCYDSMFRGCTSLTTAPALPATALASSCYERMFYGCTALSSAPALPALTLKSYCYTYMFTECTKLTTPPALPATSLDEDCYMSMFYGCTKLRTAPALPATTLRYRCYSGMFSGCTALQKPAIMAGGTTQATSANICCQYMYNGCTSLNMYTSSSGHTACYKAIAYSTSTGTTGYQSSYRMFYQCKIDGSVSGADYLTAGTQYYR